MRVLFFSEVSTGSGSFFYRVVSPIDALLRGGHQVRHCSSIEKFSALIVKFQPNAVIYYKPLFTANFEVVRELCSKFSVPLYSDFDDLSYDSSIIQESKIFSFALTESDSGTAKNMESYKKALLASDGVLVSTQGLYSDLSGKHKNVHILNNYFPDSYVEYLRLDLTTQGKKIIFYSGSSVLHGLFLEEIHAELYLTLEKIKINSLCLVVCGGIRLPSQFDRFAHQIIYKDYMSLSEYLIMLNAASLVVAPIFIDRFTKCKSWIKALEPETAGIPWVASPHPEYIELANMSKFGKIANNRHEWMDGIENVLGRNDKSVKRGNEVFLASKNVSNKLESIINAHC